MRFQSFPIDGKRVRELRKERGLTQAEIARRICDKLDLDQDEDSATSSYRRLESRGSTSRARAQAIAEILAVSLDDVQGLHPPEPYTYEHRIYTQLKSQIDAAINPVLERELERERKHMGNESPEEALKSIAKYVSARIEGAQLCRNPSELKELAELTGYDTNELLRPANCSGHWFINAFGAGTDSAQIVSGAFGLWMHLDSLLKDQLDCHGSDIRICLHRDSPWYRIEIELAKRSMIPRNLKVVRINIARCHPQAKGVSWISPSWSEDWMITDTLESWAHQYANFIQTFDAPLMPSNVSNLCLQITEYQGSRDKQVGQFVIRPELDSTTPFAQKYAVETESTHALVIRQLMPGLKAHLESALDSSPRGCWSSTERSGGLAIDFWPQSITTDSSYGLRFSVDLVEEIGQDDFRHLPWRDRDRKTFREIVDKWLK